MHDTASVSPYAARIHGTAMILAPLLLLASSVAYITAGEGINDGVLGGTFGVWCIFALAIGFVGLLRLLEPAAPRIAPVLLASVLIGCLAGVGFQTLAILTPIFGPEINVVLENLEGSDTIALFAFFPWGLLLPLSLILTGIVLSRTPLVPRWSARLLVAGGLLFAASRPEKVDVLALIADATLIAALVPIGWTMLTSARAATPARIPAPAASMSRT
jgi:hypothetical protein